MATDWRKDRTEITAEQAWSDLSLGRKVWACKMGHAPRRIIDLSMADRPYEAKQQGTHEWVEVTHFYR